MPPFPFQPDPGLFTDTSTFSGRGGWIDCQNVRFWNGRWQVIGGWTRRGTLGTLSVTGVNAIHDWATSDGNFYIAWGADAALKIEKGGALFDVTSGAHAGKWSFANYGETLIACPSNDTIFQWNLNTAVPAAAVTNAPGQVTCILVSPSRQVIALGCNEEVSGTFNTRCIRCSDTEDPTNWTTLATNNVEENVLDGDGSPIVTARMVGQYVAVWTSSELWMGQFVGDPGQTWRYERVGSHCGAISLNGVCVVGSTAYWLTPDLVFMAWSPGSEPTEIACPIINDFRSLFPTGGTKVRETFACHVGAFNECWFTYSNTAGASHLGRYVAFSLTDGKWFKGLAGRRAMHQGVAGLLGAVEQGGAIITCESGMKGFALATPSNTSLTWFINSSALFLDQGSRRFMLKTLYPDFDAAVGDVTATVTMYGHTSNDPGTSKDLPVAVGGGTALKNDFRLSGQVLTVGFSGSDGTSVGVAGSDTFARQGLCVFEKVEMGGR